MESRVETLLNAVINGETIDFNPQSRMEEYLKNCINKAGTEGLPAPQSRVDALLYRLAETISSGGGDDYNEGYAKGKVEGVKEGKKAEWDAFWDEYQSKGSRVDYTTAFAGNNWTLSTFKPKYNIQATTAYMIFRYFNSNGESPVHLDEYLKSIGIVLDFSRSVSMQYAFAHSKIASVGTIDISNAGAMTSNMFDGTSTLVSIGKLIVNEKNSFNAFFNNAVSLTNIVIEGVIAKNGFNVQWSEKLTHDSLMSIINALADKSTDTSGTEWVVTIGSENLSKLTAEEINITHQKGWEIY